MKIEGKVLNIEEKKITGNNNQYASQDVLIDCSTEHNGQELKNYLKVTFKNNSCDLLNGIQKGIEVSVECAPEGFMYEKEGETKHFQYIKAWKITPVGQQQSASTPQQQYATDANSAGMVTNAQPIAPESADDLPF